MPQQPKWAHFWVSVPKRFGPAEREAIAQDIIDYIQERTEKGLKVGGKKRFADYSDSYADSLDFEIAGKSQGEPNLKLTGDMLADLHKISDKSGRIHIGYENGSEENAKAWWNDSKDAIQRRRFLGITQDELREHILSRYA